MLRVEPGWRGRQLYFGVNLYSYLLNIVVIAVSVMFRRTLLATNGMQKARFGLFRDLGLVLRLGRDRRTAFLDLPLYLMRYHPNQISTTVASGAHWIMIRKQQDLLRILRVYGVRDRANHERYRAAVDRQVARLCRTVAVPKLGYERGTRRQRKYLPQGAWAHHRTAESAGYPQTMLWWSALAPGWLVAH